MYLPCSLSPTPAYTSSVCCSSSSWSWLLHYSHTFSGQRRCKAVGFFYSLIQPFFFFLNPFLSSPIWRTWNRSCVVLSVMEWWSSPSCCRASTVCVCCAPLKCCYKEVTLLLTSPRSPSHQPPPLIHARQDRHGDPRPGLPTAWNGSSEPVCL